jgi:tetratricopeptide (TPR) repeat protein
LDTPLHQTTRLRAYRFFSRRWFGLFPLWCCLACVGCHATGSTQNINGVKYFQQNQPQAAMYQFQQALAANPNNPDAYYNLAACYHYLGKQTGDTATLNQAENLYHQCLDLSPDHVAGHRALAVLLVDTNRTQSAFTLLQRWAARSPQMADPRLELARLHEEFGERDSARQYLTEAVTIDPANSRAWVAMASLREADGEYATALANYQRAYYLNNQQPGVAERIASLNQRMATGGSPSPGGTRMVETPRSWTQR